MDKSHKFDITTDDSGFASGSQTYESTPLVDSFQTRKRKFHELPEEEVTMGEASTPQRTTPLNLLSSTLNSATLIAQTFEKCNISSLTPNVKRLTPPTTPDKEESEFYKLHNERMQKTPPKCASLTKLGSPERNKILYGDLKTNTSIIKLFSPKFDKRRLSPAKKRLFATNRKRKVAVKVDPINFFLIERDLSTIIEKIFNYLTDIDLYRVKCVNRSWFRAVTQDNLASHRLNAYRQHKLRNKENCYVRRNLIQPSHINEDNFKLFTEVASTLSNGQRLMKCPHCMKPSILENNIGQCQFCGYVHCTKCNSFSVSGAQDFNDSCMESFLDVDSSKENDLPSFLLDRSLKDGQSTLSTSSDALTMPSTSRNRPFVPFAATNRQLNQRKSLPDMNLHRRIPYVPVIPLKSRSIDVIEPSSPPKIKNIAGSASSKKNLKRLLR